MFGQPVGQSWYFAGPAHTEAANRLFYVAEQGESFVLLLAEHGCGKTTVLKQVQSQCQRNGQPVVSLNVAAMDEVSFLRQLCGGLSIAVGHNESRSQLMTAVRDELAGRALCHSRTVIVLDDLHSAGEDLSRMIQFLAAINQQTNGAVSVVAGAEQTLSPQLQKLSALKVRLPLLNGDDAHEFVRKRLSSLGVSNTQLTEDALNAVIEYSAGSPARLARVCELLGVAVSTMPGLKVTPEVLAALTAETLAA